MEFFLGQIIQGETGLLQFTLPKNVVLVWKDGVPAEAVICETKADLPVTWMSQKQVPWKIFGSFDLIKTIFPDFNIPAGSKVISLEAGAAIQMDVSKNLIRFMGKRQKRAVIVDDSSTIRKLLRHIITSFEGWEVVAEVERAEDISDSLKKYYPDLVTLDLHLGKMNGVEAMRKFLAPKKIPTLLITSQPKEDGSLVMDALDAGALDYLQKPESGGWDILKDELFHKMEAALKSKWQNASIRRDGIQNKTYNFNPGNYLITIGSSTGGTQALQQIFTHMPATIPPILVAQHIPAGFSKALADRLNKLCPFEIKEAEDGDEVRPNRVLIAPGNHHMALSKNGKTVEVFAGEPVNRFRPSVDVLFRSVAKNSKVPTVGIILTGMGKDGADAMLELHRQGAYTIAQDEASCVVFGMPKEAIRLGAADQITSLIDMPEVIMNHLSKKSSHLKSGT